MFLLYPLFKNFYHSGCWNLSNAFSESIEIIIWFLFFILLVWYITLIDLQLLNHFCISGMNLTWSWCIFLMYGRIQLANILLRIFHLFSSEILGCKFFLFFFFSLLWFYSYSYMSKKKVDWLHKKEIKTEKQTEDPEPPVFILRLVWISKDFRLYENQS